MCSIPLDSFMAIEEADLLKTETSLNFRGEVTGITSTTMDPAEELPDLDYVAIHP